MTKIILAAAVFALGAAVPALAQEEYQSGPTRPVQSAVATHDQGSAQYPTFDGKLNQHEPNSSVLLGTAASATVEPLNSAPVGALAGVLGAFR